MKLTIYGASDDLIEVEGDFREEFNTVETEGSFKWEDLYDLAKRIKDDLARAGVSSSGEDT